MRVRQLIGACWLLLAAPCALPAADLIIRGGWVFDTAGETMVRNGGILIRGGKFLTVGAVPRPEDADEIRVLQLDDDDYVLPGIFDLHAHYNVNLFGRRRRDETRANPVIFLANGVTSTFPAGEYDPEDMLEARRRIDAGLQPGPRIFNSGPYFGSARAGWDSNAPAEFIHREVDKWAALGAAGFKAKGIGPAHLRALIERAHLHGLTVTAHLDSGYRGSVNPKDAILMGIDRIEHFLGGDAFPPVRSAYASLVNFAPGTPEFDRIVELYVKHRVFFDATITAYGYSGDRSEGYDHWVDESRYFTDYVRQETARRTTRRINAQFDKIYKVKRKTIKAFFDAGGLITLGTDHPSEGEFLAGFSAHRELDALVLSGIPPAAAIKIATLNGARALNVSEKLGSIEPGKFADFFVVRGNPLEDIRRTRGVRLVAKAGVVHDSARLLSSVEGLLGPKDAEEAAAW